MRLKATEHMALAEDMARVEQSGIPARACTDLYRKAILIRAFEQRLLALFSEGKLSGTVHTCIGQEWTGIAVAEQLRETDLVLSTHRCHGHYLARTGDVDGLLAEVMGKSSGVCGGRGGSQHIHAPGFFSNGIQGGTMPIAAGLALSQKMAGGGDLTVVFIGDGTLGEGVVYESLNFCAKWELPVLIVLENNQYAQSTAQQQTTAGEICARASAFGIAHARADTWNIEPLLDQVRESIAYVRSMGQPFFLQIDTYRLMAHSKGDDGRDSAEIEAFWRRDPVSVWKIDHPLEAKRIDEEVSEQLETAVGRAEHSAPSLPASTFDLSREGSKPLRWVRTRIKEPDRSVNLIHASLQRNMGKNPRIVLLGEDIEGPYGGAFKVTKQLSQEFPGRVRSTPISEAAIVGMGNGLALAGWLPLCEIMFGDFLTLAFDQFLNHAAKFRYMYNDQVRVPLIVRTPMGGKRGYGATHSQSIEKHFLGIPGTQVLALHSRYDPGLLYDQLLATIDRPTLVIENKLLYGVRVTDQVAAGFVLEHTEQEFPITRITPQAKPQVTVLCYGGMLPDVEKAIELLFDEHEIACEVLCPAKIYPLDIHPILESVKGTGRLAIVEEGQGFAAFGSEAVAQIVENVPGILRRLCRISAAPHAIPACSLLEKQVLPGPAHIVESIVALCSE
jgi:2-oxoisovalerate dehydrogenase E1 component